MLAVEVLHFQRGPDIGGGGRGPGGYPTQDLVLLVKLIVDLVVEEVVEFLVVVLIQTLLVLVVMVVLVLSSSLIQSDKYLKNFHEYTQGKYY